MSWTDEELDNLVRNASKHEPKPIYQDEYFDEIVHLLPKKKKNNWWLLVFSPSLLLPFFFLNVEQTDLSSEKYHKSVFSTKKMLDFNANKENVSSKVSNINRQESLIANTLGIEKNRLELGEIQQMESPTKVEIKQSKVQNTAVDALTLKEIVLVESDLNQELSAFSMNLKSKANFLTFNAQLGLSSSLVKETNTKPAIVVDFGVAYQRQFKSLNAEVGLNFSAFIPQEMSFEKTSKVYGVKINRYQQQLSYHAIYALDLPLQISKSFNRNSLSLSVAPQYFLGGTVAVSQMKNDQQMTNNLYVGIKHGINNFGLKGAIGYQYRFANNYEFGVKITAQFINPLKTEVLGVALNNSPLIGQFTFKKYIKLK
jgi:hypothetical protein